METGVIAEEFHFLIVPNGDSAERLWRRIMNEGTEDFEEDDTFETAEIPLDDERSIFIEVVSYNKSIVVQLTAYRIENGIRYPIKALKI